MLQGALNHQGLKPPDVEGSFRPGHPTSPLSPVQQAGKKKIEKPRGRNSIQSCREVDGNGSVSAPKGLL